MKVKAGIFLIGSLALCAALLAQVPSGREVVKPEVYASLDPAGRGSSFQIAVVMKIRPGFHVNAREKSEEYLIATDLKAALPAGFSGGEVSYPKGKLENSTERLPGHRDSSHAGYGAGERPSRRAAHPTEASLPGLQHRTLPAPGHPYSRRNAECGCFNLRRQARSPGNFRKAISCRTNAVCGCSSVVGTQHA